MNYFILNGRQQQGPYTVDELRSRNITSATLVWADGMEQWTPAWQVKELQPLFGVENSVEKDVENSVENVVDNSFREDEKESVNTSESEDKEEVKIVENEMPHFVDKKRRYWGTKSIVLACVLAVFVILIATCPSADRHREAVTTEIGNAIADLNEDSQDAWGMIGSMITSRLVGVVVSQLLEVDNYGVCSVGRVHIQKKSEVVSFGVLGHVFTFNDKDVSRAIEGGKDDSEDTFSAPAVDM